MFCAPRYFIPGEAAGLEEGEGNLELDVGAGFRIRGGILADKVGYGKTATCLGLLASCDLRKRQEELEKKQLLTGKNAVQSSNGRNPLKGKKPFSDLLMQGEMLQGTQKNKLNGTQKNLGKKTNPSNKAATSRQQKMLYEGMPKDETLWTNAIFGQSR
jgi:hypothetical protein